MTDPLDLLPLSARRFLEDRAAEAQPRPVQVAEIAAALLDNAVQYIIRNKTTRDGKTEAEIAARAARIGRRG